MASQPVLVVVSFPEAMVSLGVRLKIVTFSLGGEPPPCTPSSSSYGQGIGQDRKYRLLSDSFTVSLDVKVLSLQGGRGRGQEDPA